MQPTYKFPHVPELADRAGVPFFDRAGVLTERKTQDVYRNSLFVPASFFPLVLASSPEPPKTSFNPINLAQNHPLKINHKPK